MSRKYACSNKQFTAKNSCRIQAIYLKIRPPFMTEVNAMQFLAFRYKPNTSFVLLPSSIPDYYIKSSSKYFAVFNRVRIIQTQCVSPVKQYLSRCLTNTKSRCVFDNKSIGNYRIVQSGWLPCVEFLFIRDPECFLVNK